MSELLRADISQQTFYLGIRHSEALVEVTQGSGEFAVGTSELRDNDLSPTGIGLFDIDRVLKFIAISLLYIRLIENPHSA